MAGKEEGCSVDAGLELIRNQDPAAADFSVLQAGTSSFAGPPVLLASAQAGRDRSSEAARDTQVSTWRLQCQF